MAKSSRGRSAPLAWRLSMLLTGGTAPPARAGQVVPHALEVLIARGLIMPLLELADRQDRELHGSALARPSAHPTPPRSSRTTTHKRTSTGPVVSSSNVKSFSSFSAGS